MIKCALSQPTQYSFFGAGSQKNDINKLNTSSPLRYAVNYFLNCWDINIISEKLLNSLCNSGNAFAIWIITNIRINILKNLQFPQYHPIIVKHEPVQPLFHMTKGYLINIFFDKKLDVIYGRLT